MDLYFKAASIALFGTIFLMLVALVGDDLGRSQKLFNALLREPINYLNDVNSVRKEFVVDISAFHQFVISNQGKHYIFLDNGLYNMAVEPGGNRRFQDNDLYLVYFRINSGVGSLPGVSHHGEISIVNPLTAPPAAEVGDHRRVVDVSGTPGYASNSVIAFINHYTTNNPNNSSIRVRRFVREDGRVILFADWMVF